MGLKKVVGRELVVIIECIFYEFIKKYESWKKALGDYWYQIFCILFYFKTILLFMLDLKNLRGLSLNLAIDQAIIQTKF